MAAADSDPPPHRDPASPASSFEPRPVSTQFETDLSRRTSRAKSETVTAPTASPRTARSADFRWKYTHRKTTEGGRRLPGTTSCPPTCQEAAVGIGYPAEEPWSRRGERKKERKKKRSVARQSRAALACKEPGTLFFFFPFQMGGEATAAPITFVLLQQVGNSTQARGKAHTRTRQ